MAKHGFKIGVDIGASKVLAALIKNGRVWKTQNINNTFFYLSL